jgi:hypothetical protein
MKTTISGDQVLKLRVYALELKKKDPDQPGIHPETDHIDNELVQPVGSPAQCPSQAP